MKELITFVLKPLSFLPALAIMYIIYSFSGQTGEESGNLSYEVSVKIVEIGNQVLDIVYLTVCLVVRVCKLYFVSSIFELFLQIGTITIPTLQRLCRH